MGRAGMSKPRKEYFVSDIKDNDKIVAVGTLSEISKELGISISCLIHGYKEKHKMRWRYEIRRLEDD